MVKFSKSKIKQEAKEWAEAIIIALILTLIIRTFVIQAFKIPSSSMYPTLKKGDKLFVNKFLYKFKEPERWDIVVFKYPEDPSKDFIKRIVALEGEVIEIRDGHLRVNDQRVDLPEEIKDNVYYNQEPYSGVDQAISVPEGSLFVLGDNSLSSRDSRYWGFVNKNSLVGKAVIRWWPPKRIGRLDRIFNTNNESP